MSSILLHRACAAAHPFSTHSSTTTKTTRSISCHATLPRDNNKHSLATTGAALLASAALFLSSPTPALADLNKFEAELGGEFGRGTALQFGEADIKGKDFSNQDLRRSNFTSADCRDCNFKNAKLVGVYFIKSVLARANLENADMSDALADRAVFVDSSLRNAVLQRTVFTRSDFAGADITGADFTNALLDKTQQMAMCKRATGVNSVTGVETRKSLGCQSRRAFKASTPSNPEGPSVADAEKDAFRASQAVYRE